LVREKGLFDCHHPQKKRWAGLRLLSLGGNHKEFCDYHRNSAAERSREIEGIIVRHEPPTNSVIPAQAGIQEMFPLRFGW
jgi:hypothetical protein